jgi:hypothetical protein
MHQNATNTLLMEQARVRKLEDEYWARHTQIKEKYQVELRAMINSMQKKQMAGTANSNPKSARFFVQLQAWQRLFEVNREGNTTQQTLLLHFQEKCPMSHTNTIAC